MRIGIVLVHYRTPELVRTALEALERSEGLGSEGLGSTGLDLVVVDNSSGPAGRALLESLPARLVTPGGNLGYAGGVNLGFSELSTGELRGKGPDVLIAMNPDVLVAPSCLAELVRAVRNGAEVAGPRFVWGDGPSDQSAAANDILMPPGDAIGRRSALGHFLAESRGGHWAHRARATWRRHAQRHWTATADLPSYSLSGALLAVTRDAWSRVGQFDEGYRLYFEETDFLRRAKKLDVPSRYVPAAIAHHGYARSTPMEPQAASWFANSERRFRRRWYGRAFASFLASLARRNPPRPTEVDDGAEGEPKLGPNTRWVEISASPLGLPSGGMHLPGGCAANARLLDVVPSVVAERSEKMTLYWRTVDVEGRESSSLEIRRAG